jgi:hypothetical protein
MSLVVPDPTRAVPLPLREQADVRDRWLTQRLLDLLPGLMDRAGIDLWLVIGREYNEDPVLATLLPATWISARRRTILVLHRSDDGVTPAAVSRYPVGQFLPAWSADEAPGPPTEESQWAAVRRIVQQADPRRIGIDVSESFAPSTGCSPRRSGPTPTGSCRPRSSPSGGWRPGFRRRSGRCTPSTGSCTR